MTWPYVVLYVYLSLGLAIGLDHFIFYHRLRGKGSFLGGLFVVVFWLPLALCAMVRR